MSKTEAQAAIDKAEAASRAIAFSVFKRRYDMAQNIPALKRLSSELKAKMISSDVDYFAGGNLRNKIQDKIRDIEYLSGDGAAVSRRDKANVRDYTDSKKYLIVDGKSAIPKYYMQLSTEMAIYLLRKKISRKSFLRAFHIGAHGYYLMPVYKNNMLPIQNTFLLDTNSPFYINNGEKISFLMNKIR